jgi:tetratricopeptide (TPR) repeat protein
MPAFRWWRAPYDLLVRPSRFFVEAPLAAGGVWIVLIWITGAAHVVSRLERQLLRAELMGPQPGSETLLPLVTESWTGFWIFLFAAGAISGTFIWYIWGWWYRIRLRLSGATTIERRTARLVLTFAMTVWSVPAIVAAVVETFVYSNFRAAFDAVTPWQQVFSLVSIVLLTWSVIVSYQGVRARFDVKPRAAQVWFLILPLATYGSLLAFSLPLMQEGAESAVASRAVGDDVIDPEAEALHAEARRIAAAGRYQEALALFTKAMAIAPRWPYPVYDRALTHLLMNESDAALADYRRTVELSPRGFFTAHTAVDTLEREQRGEFRRGLYRDFLQLEQVTDATERRVRLQRHVDEAPGFAPAWQHLATLADNPTDRLRLIERGLASRPDIETRGMLQMNKYFALSGTGDRTTADQILRDILSDPAASISAQAWARMMAKREP